MKKLILVLLALIIMCSILNAKNSIGVSILLGNSFGKSQNANTAYSEKYDIEQKTHNSFSLKIYLKKKMSFEKINVYMTPGISLTWDMILIKSKRRSNEHILYFYKEIYWREKAGVEIDWFSFQLQKPKKNWFTNISVLSFGACLDESKRRQTMLKFFKAQVGYKNLIMEISYGIIGVSKNLGSNYYLPPTKERSFSLKVGYNFELFDL